MASRTETKIQVTGYPWCARVITPHATDPLMNYQSEPQPMTVQATSAGAINCVPFGNEDAETMTFTLEAGEFIPVLVRRVLVSGTTATCIGVW